MYNYSLYIIHCTLFYMNLHYHLCLVRIIRNHEDTRGLHTRFLQFGSHCRHLHLHGFSRLNLALLQTYLQAHGKHLHASDVEFRLTLVGESDKSLQLLLAVETAEVQFRCRYFQLRSLCLLDRKSVV